jgi:hypothetical protein
MHTGTKRYGAMVLLSLAKFLPFYLMKKEEILLSTFIEQE